MNENKTSPILSGNPKMSRTILSFAALLFLGLTAVLTHAEPAAKSIEAAAKKTSHDKPLSERFAGKSTDEVPDFQKHVVPLLGRLGCNGRACHGSFQGRGGFQLSLFGYDFEADHQALLEEESGRVDTDDVAESLILAKPSDADMHEGGQRFDVDSWQYRVLSRWIEAGAKHDDTEPQVLEQLEILPREVQFSSADQSVSLTAIAHWQDGTREDVTELCRFSSNDDSIALIDETGKLNSGETGGTHVVVYYDNAVVPIPVMRSIASGSSHQKQRAYEQPIDQLVDQKIAKLGIEPSGPCTDAEFIRRVSLDIAGILPTSDKVREFLADGSDDKRARLIEDLLQSPGYAAWWATRFSDWTGNSSEQLNNALPVRGVASKLWYAWLRKRLDENMPYDEMMEGIVMAKSREQGEDYRGYCENMTKLCMPGNEDLYAAREGLPLFWARRNFQKPEERAIGFAYTFLGVRIECAQCHKHPFDQWSKNDFEDFSKLFTPIQARQNQVSPDDKKTYQAILAEVTGGEKLNGGELRKKVYTAARKGEVVPFGELVVKTRTVPEKTRKARKKAKEKGRKLPPLRIPSGIILGQEDSLLLDKDPRAELMEWLRSPENPYFAKAIVNRVWSNYFGIGIVDPSDDMNLANPPSNAPLLDYLASELIAHDFDLRWLHRTITSSETYQRSAVTNQTNASDQSNFARHVPRRLPAEVVYDSIVLATGSDTQTDRLRNEMDEMAIADGKSKQRKKQDFALEVFGQSIRETNCDCDRSDAPSLLQSIYLRNDVDIYKRLADKQGWVAQACKTMGVAGPIGSMDVRKKTIQKRAIAQRAKFIRRIKQFQKMPNKRQEKSIEQLRKDHGRISKKFAENGYKVPQLNRLIADVACWNPIDSPQANENSGETIASLDSLIEEAYLRTLSRFPEQEETNIATEFISESKTPADGLQSLLWALVNTKEFIISH